jgi:diaminopimelate decarboxylase
MTIHDLDTPALVIDLDKVDRNIARMADYCRRHNLKLRPHTKTHKMPGLAKQQVQSGASGITVAKLGEAEIMVDAGLDDLLVAYPIVGQPKARRLAALCERVRMTVALDSLESLEFVGQSTRERASWSKSMSDFAGVEFRTTKPHCGWRNASSTIRHSSFAASSSTQEASLPRRPRKSIWLR